MEVENMVEYRRKDNKDTWHWCRNCANDPKLPGYATSPTKPTSGELCNECKHKDETNDCRK